MLTSNNDNAMFKIQGNNTLSNQNLAGGLGAVASVQQIHNIRQWGLEGGTAHTMSGREPGTTHPSGNLMVNPSR